MEPVIHVLPSPVGVLAPAEACRYRVVSILSSWFYSVTGVMGGSSGERAVSGWDPVSCRVGLGWARAGLEQERKAASERGDVRRLNQDKSLRCRRPQHKQALLAEDSEGTQDPGSCCGAAGRCSAHWRRTDGAMGTPLSPHFCPYPSLVHSPPRAGQGALQLRG